jgi:hypothetical protein
MLRLLACFGLTLIALALPAQVPNIEHPNLSGTWKLNLSRSGPILPRGTEALIITFEHRDPLIRYSETRIVAGKTTHSEGKMKTIDGRFLSDHPPRGNTERSMQKWEGSTLIMEWELTDAKGTTYISSFRTSLSSDGKVLTMSEHYRSGARRLRRSPHCVRQDPWRARQDV